MKKILFVAAIFAVFSSYGKAQDKKIEFGFLGGYGYTSPKITGVTANDNLNGFHFGPTIKLNINSQIGFQTGIYYNYFNGTNITSSQLALKKSIGTWNQTRTNLTAFDIPFRIVYSTPLAEDFKMFVFAGPNFNYAMKKVTITENYSNNKLLNNTPGANIYESINYKPFDTQVGVGIGIQWYGISIRGSYDWGLMNRTTLEKTTFKQNDLKVSLGYTF